MLTALPQTVSLSYSEMPTHWRNRSRRRRSADEGAESMPPELYADIVKNGIYSPAAVR